MVEKSSILVISCLWLIAIIGCARKDPMERVLEFENKGQFQEAKAYIDGVLTNEVSAEQRNQLLFEKERLERIKLDYDLTRDSLIQSLKSRVKDFTLEEFQGWDQAGCFDSRVIDGAKTYLYCSVSNLFYRHPDIRKRSIGWYDPNKTAGRRWEQVQRIKEAAARTSGPLVLPQRFRARMTVTVKEGAVPEGKTVRCWMPLPRLCLTQNDIELISSSPEVKWLSHPLNDIRSVYFEQQVKKDRPTRFELEYAYTSYAYFQDVDPEKVLPYEKDNPIFQRYTRPQPPHVVFTDNLRQLAREIVGEETNPYLKAKRIYGWIADNILYSYAHEYSVIRNISQFVYDHRYGDCGQEHLLFIALCRIAGVAARWQSGWTMRPGDPGLHDWAEIYVEPYGWLPVDVTRAIFFTNYVDALDPSQLQEIRDFYFGGMDHFRLVVNKGHNLKLYPPKRTFRSEPVDFQRGELEYDDVNLYYDKFDYHMDVEAIND